MHNNITNFSCPPPFILDPHYKQRVASLYADSCQAGCCIPCPMPYSLYSTGALDGFRASTILKSVSAVAALLLVISYLFLPKKREHPALLILFSAIAILIYSAGGFFALIEPRKLQCGNQFISSTMHNNQLCLIGLLNVFGTHATVTWLTALIVNLHLHTVWNCKALQSQYLLIHTFCWGLPLLLTVLTASKGAIKYEFGEMCTVDYENAEKLFFYPIFGLVVPAFIIHLCTFFHIGKISMKARSQEFSRRILMMMAITIQWRALALTVSLAASVLFFSLFYFSIVQRLRDISTHPQVLNDWATCLLQGGDQNTCAYHNLHLLPTPGQMLAGEIIMSVMGLVFFAIFAIQRQFFKEWKEKIWGKPLPPPKLERKQDTSVVLGGMVVLSMDQFGAIYSPNSSV